MRTLKLKCLFLFTVSLFLSFSSKSFSQVTYIEVVPSGGSEDADNIQSALDAVDAGGTVHLIAGTFDFQRQRVLIQKPCVLEGETDGNGNLSTTILNAGDPNVQEDEDAIDIYSGGVTVKDLKFEGLGSYGIILWPEPYWGPEANNETVTIKNNNIGDLTGYSIGCYYVPCSIEILDNTISECYIGIFLGYVSGTLLKVEGNVIKSYGTSARYGIYNLRNSANYTIVNNDFSELTTWEAQVAIFGGQNHLVKDNVFGPSNGEGLNLSYPTTAVALRSINCTLMNNDYRRCQLPGWSYDESGNLMGGCVLILDFGSGVYDNFIMEVGKFPSGTGGPRQQIVEVPDPNVYNNRIVGHRANEIAYLENEFPGIGQKIKESYGEILPVSSILNEKGVNGKFMGEANQNIFNNVHTSITYILSQNYPNPFNPNTTIKYQIPEPGFVTLKVFDVLGKEVAVLVNEEKQPGNYEVEFNGSRFASGLYFYKIQTGEFVETKKMVLMK